MEPAGWVLGQVEDTHLRATRASSRRRRAASGRSYRPRPATTRAAGDEFGIALANARSVGYPILDLAPLLQDYGAWLVACGRVDEAEPLLAESRELYEQMGATARLEELDRIHAPAEIAR